MEDHTGFRVGGWPEVPPANRYPVSESASQGYVPDEQVGKPQAMPEQRPLRGCALQLLLLAILIGAAWYFFRPPPPKPDPKAVLSAALVEAESKLQVHERARAHYLNEVKAAVGVPLGAPVLPDDLAWLIAEERTVAEAWTTMLNNQVADGVIRADEDNLSSIKQHLQANILTSEDEGSLKQILDRVVRRTASIELSRQKLNHIRVMLKARQLKAVQAEKGQ